MSHSIALKIKLSDFSALLALILALIITPILTPNILSAQSNYDHLKEQAEDGIRDSVASRGLGDVYKRQI